MLSNRSNPVGIILDHGASVIEQFLDGLTPQRVRELLNGRRETPIPWVPGLTLGEIYDVYSRNAERHGAENLMDRLLSTHRFINRHAGNVLHAIERAAVAEAGEDMYEPFPDNAVSVFEDRALQNLIDGARRQFAVFRDTEAELEVAERVHEAAAQTQEAKNALGAANFVLVGATSMAARHLADNPDHSFVVNRGTRVLYATLPQRLGELSIGLSNAAVRRDGLQAFTEVRRFGLGLLGRGAAEFLVRRYTTSFFARAEQTVRHTLGTQPWERTAAEAIILSAGVYVGASLIIGPTAGAILGNLLASEVQRAVAVELTNQGVAIATAVGRNAISRVGAAASHADRFARSISMRNLRDGQDEDMNNRNSPAR